MTAVVEAMGLTLPGASSIPAVDAGHGRLSTACGSRIVEMVEEDLKPSKIVSRRSFENGITTDMAIGGSTNAILHILALAGRAGVDLELEDFDRISRNTPVIANIRPSGQYLMEDFYYAGGLRGLLWRIRNLLDIDCLTVNGKTLGENVRDAPVHDGKVILPLDDPVAPEGSTVILRGNLAPNGAVMKPAAAESRLLQHSGPAVVFKNYRDLVARIDSPDLEIDQNSVLVLQNAGPLGAPGMPEWGMLPIPQKLLKKGVRDMVRISDARMSGTSYGACVLHVAPETYLGGPLALVQDGDLIELDVPKRTLQVRLSGEELQRRRDRWQPPSTVCRRGYLALFIRHVTQADRGCDFDFLEGAGGVPEPEIH
jgi:dihydroxy-acid dehydratase